MVLRQRLPPRRASLWLVMPPAFSGMYFYVISDRRRVLDVFLARACLPFAGHCLYPGAVLPVRSQVFMSLDSGRRITRPQDAAHPFPRRLWSRAFDGRYSFPCRRRRRRRWHYTSQISSTALRWHCLKKPWVHAGGDRGPRRWPQRLARTRDFLLFDSRLLPSCRFEWHPPLRSSLFPPCAVCHLTLVSPAVLFAYLRTPPCVWSCPEGEFGGKTKKKKTRLGEFCAQAIFDLKVQCVVFDLLYWDKHNTNRTQDATVFFKISLGASGNKNSCALWPSNWPILLNVLYEEGHDVLPVSARV